MQHSGTTARETTAPGKSLGALLRLFVALILIGFLGLQVVEASHLHQTVALERDCPVCQASGHQTLDLPPLPLAPPAAILFLLFILSGWHLAARIDTQPFAHPNARAPPELHD